MGDKSRRPAVRRAAGGVVYHEGGGGRAFLLIRDPYGRWSLPKGHLEGQESEAEAAVREVFEETGVRAEIGPLVARISYGFSSGGRPIEKQVAFFLMRSDTSAAQPQTEEGITAVEWFAEREAAERIGYDQIRQVFHQALALLAERRA